MTDNGKKRISSLAKEFEVTSEVFLRLVKEAGLEAKTASSMLDAAGVQKVKPFLDAEKEKKQREELVKSGKKIPMKAVLKKAPPPPPPPAPKPVLEEKKTPEPPPVVVPEPKPVAEVIPPKPIVPEAKVETPAPEIPQVKPVEPPSASAPVEPAAAPAKSVSTPADAEAKARQLHSELKVSVEKPDAALLARIAKSRAENAARFRSREEREQGYSGQLHRAPPGGPRPGGPGREGGTGGRSGGPYTPGSGGGGYGGPRGPGGGGPGRGPSGPYRSSPGGPGGPRTGGLGPGRSPRPDRPGFDSPKDIYALRAQEAGVVTGGGKSDRDKDKEKERIREIGQGGAPGAASRGRGGHRRKSREQIEQELLEARNNVTKVMASLSRTPAKGRLKDRKEDEDAAEGAGKRQLNVSEFVTIGELAGAHRATFLMATPTFCATYVRKCEPHQFAHLRYAIVGAEKLREPIARAFQEKFGIALLEGYGCTEMSPVVAIQASSNTGFNANNWINIPGGPIMPGGTSIVRFPAWSGGCNQFVSIRTAEGRTHTYPVVNVCSSTSFVVRGW